MSRLKISWDCNISFSKPEAKTYKIQDTRCIFRASEATLSGFSSEKGHEQVLLKSIKHMQVHIIQYRNAGDDEIETFRITITSHRWSWVNIYSIYRWTLGPKVKGVIRSCSDQVEE